jgi:hypothetical protein
MIYYVCHWYVQDDQKVSVHLMITVHKTQKKMTVTEYIRNVVRAMLTTVFENIGVSINVWGLAGDTLNISCNFLYCDH